MKEGIIVLAIHISKFAFLHLIQQKKKYQYRRTYKCIFLIVDVGEHGEGGGATVY
jgi:hypothetical protein